MVFQEHQVPQVFLDQMEKTEKREIRESEDLLDRGAKEVCQVQEEELEKMVVMVMPELLGYVHGRLQDLVQKRKD